MTAMMLGACVVFVGTLSLVAMVVVGKATGPSAVENDATPVLVPADKLHGTPPSTTDQGRSSPSTAGRKTSQIL